MILSDQRYLRLDLRLAAYSVAMAVTFLYYRLSSIHADYNPRIPDLIIVFLTLSTCLLGNLHKGKNTLQIGFVIFISVSLLTIPVVLIFRNYYVYESRSFFHALGIIALISISYRYFVKQLWRWILTLLIGLTVYKVLLELILSYILERDFFKPWLTITEVISINSLICYVTIYGLGLLLGLGFLYLIWIRRKAISISITDLLILSGCLMFACINILRVYVIFKGYSDNDFYYLIETFSLVPCIIWLVAFDRRGDTQKSKYKNLFWLIQTSFLVILFLIIFQGLPKESTLLHLLFVLSMSMVLEALLLFGSLFFLLYRESLNQAREIVRLSSQLGSIKESVHDGIFVVDTHGVIEDVNLGAEKLTGKNRVSLVGTSWTELIRPSQSAPASSLDGGHEQYYCLNNRAESVICINGVSVSFGGRDLMVYAARDMTRLQQEVEKNERLKGQLIRSQKMEAVAGLARGVAHDFNNYLTGIRGAGQLLERFVEPGTKARKYVTMVLESADEATHLVHQLLDSVRVERQNARAVNVDEIVRQACKLIIPQLGSINLVTHSTPDIPDIWVDPSELMRCLMNLMRNAIQAMGQDGELNVSTQRVENEEIPISGDTVRYFENKAAIAIEISDTGPGIPSHIRDRIFEPFFTTKSSREGTGLGLGITYGIVKSYNGVLDLITEEGKGTTFIMYFPEYTPQDSQ